MYVSFLISEAISHSLERSYTSVYDNKEIKNFDKISYFYYDITQFCSSPCTVKAY